LNAKWNKVCSDNIHKRNLVAVVVDKKWEDLVNMFTGKGLREFPVECFEPSEKNIIMA
jgi:hypothetical protein